MMWMSETDVSVVRGFHIILVGEIAESSFPFLFDSIIILQNKRD